MKRAFLTGAVLVVITALAFTACSKKEGGSSGSANAQSGGKSSVKENPTSDFSYELTDDKQGIRIKGYTGQRGPVVIPATIEGIPVVEIGMADSTSPNRLGTLSGNTLITELVMPSSITKIGQRFFYNSSSGAIVLSKITLPDGIKEIPPFAFASCKNLTTINLPANLETIYNDSFSSGSLTEITIPDSLTSVKFLWWDGVMITEKPNINAFRGCSKLPLATRARIESLGYTGNF